METVPSMTIMAYTPFSSSRKFGQRTHYVNGWLCRVYEWEENLNPKISIFRYEEIRQAKKREDDRRDAKKSVRSKAPSTQKSFDPRSAAALPAVNPAKSRAEIAKEKEARFFERRARERAQRREAEAAARRRREAASAEHAREMEPAVPEEEELLLPSARPRPAMPWQNKTGVATSGIRQSRPARLTAAPQKKAKEE